MDYATRVKALRAIKGWSQIDLAKAANVPNFDLSKIETGKMLPNPDWDEAIRDALGWSAEVDVALDQLAAALALDAAQSPSTEVAA
jgi:ribosome-binding protein aMBF1 (putative translation factor)